MPRIRSRPVSGGELPALTAEFYVTGAGLSCGRR